jgi:AcrR family transcriptional regulator
MTTEAELRWVREPRQARSRETLDRILDAAEALVSDKGFADATLAEIVRRADSSVGAFYTRFRDKEGLLYALYERYLEQAVATADEALDPTRWQRTPVPELLGAVVRFLVTIYREQGGLIRAFVLRNHTDAEFRARQARLSHYVARKLGAVLLDRRDEITHPDPERAVAFGLSMVFSTIEDNVLFGETRSSALALRDDDIAAELTRAYLAYLGVSAPGNPAPRGTPA